MKSPSRIAASLLVLSIACSSDSTPPSVPSSPGTTTPIATTTWTQVWSDEFDGPAGASIDATKWGYDLGNGCNSGNCGWGNNEKESYTNAAENVSLNGQGQLAIVAFRTPAGLITSARINTRGKFAAGPGRVEARVKLPVGQGVWPAFWMLGNTFPSVPWPACGELDIMENRGSSPAISSSAVHGPGYSGNTPFAHQTATQSGTFGDAYHVFAVEWNAQQVIFSVDSVPHYNVGVGDMQRFGAPILDQPYFIILNLAVGGNYDGDPRSDAIFPATMLVDYVRVYTASTK